MEIYTQEVSKITIPMPTGFSSTTVHFFQRGVEVGTGSNASATTATSIDVDIPYALTRMDTSLELRIDFFLAGNQEQKFVAVDVVTPLLPLNEVKSILNPANPSSVTDTRAKDIERKVRMAIQAHTDQFFGKYQGYVEVYGNGDGFIQSPRRILSIDSLDFNNVSYSAHSYIIKGNGWYIERARGYPLTIKQAPPEEVLDAYTTSSNGPIAPPDATYYNTFNSKVSYRVNGTFGYDYVPSDVAAAARLLVNDYGCNESLYRDRYIGSIRAADWRFDFKDGAYLGTGNVQADQLLAPYKRSNMVVI